MSRQIEGLWSRLVLSSTVRRKPVKSEKKKKAMWHRLHTAIVPHSSVQWVNQVTCNVLWAVYCLSSTRPAAWYCAIIWQELRDGSVAYPWQQSCCSWPRSLIACLIKVGTIELEKHFVTWHFHISQALFATWQKGLHETYHTGNNPVSVF